MRFLILVLCLAFSGSTLGAASGELDAIEGVFYDRFVSLWQAGDAAGLAELWHEDGDWMNLVGSRRVLAGREQIEQVWSVGLQGRHTPEQRHLEIEIDSVKLLGPTLAHVDLVMTFGHDTTGTIEEAMSATLRKGERGWQISTCRVARISTSPASP